MEKLIRWFRQLSIPVTFGIYMTVCLLGALLLSMLTIQGLEAVRSDITQLYVGESETYYLTTPDGKRLGEGVNVIVNPLELTASDKRKVNLLDIASSLAMPLIFAISIVLAALLFYRQKMKAPLSILNIATDHISAQQLDFKVEYPINDEFGRLVQSFEAMRASLAQNYTEMWRMIEERKQVNAAFSHDLRTPLTVLKGQLELIQQATHDSRLSEQKLAAHLEKMSQQVQRLEYYASSMQELQRLEAIKPQPRPVSLQKLAEQMKDIHLLLQPPQTVQFDSSELPERRVMLDTDLLMRVYENLLNNALVYSKSRVDVKLAYGAYGDQQLELVVADDGKGFSNEDLKRATEPYYRSEQSSRGCHLGLGLSISRLLCEKHGGGLQLANQPQGGAIVTASFYAANKAEQA